MNNLLHRMCRCFKNSFRTHRTNSAYRGYAQILGTEIRSEHFRSAPRTSRRAYCTLRMPWSAHWEVVAWST